MSAYLNKLLRVEPEVNHQFVVGIIGPKWILWLIRVNADNFLQEFQERCDSMGHPLVHVYYAALN